MPRFTTLKAALPSPTTVRPDGPAWKNLLAVEPPEPRPLRYWLKRYPPGWVSRHSVVSADPMALARQIHTLVVAFVEWLRTPPEQRWDTFTLQSLSAALFNRYLLKRDRWPKRNLEVDVGLLELPWPAGSEAVQRCLGELQELLGPPLAVFKAVRSAVPAADFPTPRELQLAEDALNASQPRLRQLAEDLEWALASPRENAPRPVRRPGFNDFPQ